MVEDIAGIVQSARLSVQELRDSTLMLDGLAEVIAGGHPSIVKNTAMVTAALTMALLRRDHAGRVAGSHVIHHRDAGSQGRVDGVVQCTSMAFAETRVLGWFAGPTLTVFSQCRAQCCCLHHSSRSTSRQSTPTGDYLLTLHSARSSLSHVLISMLAAGIFDCSS
ncbi:hypothetical protein [Rhodococcus wratislaviensis]|uniref:hypothetical protein n=1 Tax=Rhodococcus wratislaviensis TaxID=44752 RepID=UPI0005632581|nr:hypothetical protein [Rhodococcus wratislaviensis]